jgi:Ca2+/Na+ antiporter
MTKSPNAPIFLVLAFLGLIAFLIATTYLNFTASGWFYAGFIFCAVISLFRRERWWYFSVMILLAAAVLFVYFTVGSTSNTISPPVQR